MPQVQPVGAYLDRSKALIAVGSSLTLDESHNGKTMLLDTLAGSTCTLPEATGTGLCYYFKVSVVPTSNAHVVQVASDDTIDGSILGCADGGDSVVGWESAATSDTISLNGTTTGGVTIGDCLELMDIGTGQWVVKGVITQSGTEATPFSAAVS